MLIICLGQSVYESINAQVLYCKYGSTGSNTNATGINHDNSNFQLCTVLPSETVSL